MMDTFAIIPFTFECESINILIKKAPSGWETKYEFGAAYITKKSVDSHISLFRFDAGCLRLAIDEKKREEIEERGIKATEIKEALKDIKAKPITVGNPYFFKLGEPESISPNSAVSKNKNAIPIIEYILAKVCAAKTLEREIDKTMDKLSGETWNSIESATEIDDFKSIVSILRDDTALVGDLHKKLNNLLSKLNINDDSLSDFYRGTGEVMGLSETIDICSKKLEGLDNYSSNLYKYSQQNTSMRMDDDTRAGQYAVEAIQPGLITVGIFVFLDVLFHMFHAEGAYVIPVTFTLIFALFWLIYCIVIYVKGVSLKLGEIKKTTGDVTYDIFVNVYSLLMLLFPALYFMHNVEFASVAFMMIYTLMFITVIVLAITTAEYERYLWMGTFVFSGILLAFFSATIAFPDLGLEEVIKEHSSFVAMMAYVFFVLQSSLKWILVVIIGGMYEVVSKAKQVKG